MTGITLRGHGASKGVAEGEALVTEDRICFSFDVDVKTGIILAPSSRHKGQSVAGRVWVFPMGRGSTTSPYGLYMLKKSGNAPKAIINVEGDPTVVSSAVICDVPMVYGLDRNPMEVIETGDYVRVDADRGIAEVTKAGVIR